MPGLRLVGEGNGLDDRVTKWAAAELASRVLVLERDLRGVTLH